MLTSRFRSVHNDELRPPGLWAQEGPFFWLLNRLEHDALGFQGPGYFFFDFQKLRFQRPRLIKGPVENSDYEDFTEIVPGPGQGCSEFGNSM